jgi:tetratricopeptide (TPR) repeat protein
MMNRISSSIWKTLGHLCLAVVFAVAFSACAGKGEKDEAAVDEVKETPESDGDGEETAQTDQGETESEPDDAKSEEQEQKEKAETDEPERESTEVDRRSRSKIESAINAARQGDRKRALNKLDGMLNDDAGYLAAYNMGIIHESEGETKKAAKRYQQALTKNADFSPALLNLVRLYIRNNQVSDADAIARNYMDKRPENMAHRAAHLEVDLHKGQYEEVIRAAKKILRRDEKNVDAMLAMAEANMELERYELARAILDRAVEIEPQRAEIYFKYGVISDQEGVSAAAIDGYKQALKRRTDYPEAHNNLGVLYHEARDYKAAIKQFNAAIKWAPSFKEAYLNRGNSLKGDGSFEKAASSFQKALEIDPKYADALFNLGILYLDSDFEAMDKIPELRKSVEFFEKYKSVKTRVPEDDLVHSYLQEAKKAIEVEKQRQEMMRQQQQQPE